MKLLSIFAMGLMSLSAFAGIQNALQVEEVINSYENQIAADVDARVECLRFTGTYHGNSLILKPTARGGSGKYQHRIVWQLSESYDTFQGQRMQRDISIKDGRTYRFDIPELKPDVSYLQQSILLITQDKVTGQSTTSEMMFNVSRPVILSQTNDPAKLENNCFQVMPAIESVSGILTNGSTNPSQILIRHGVQSLWTRTKGSQWGFFISPFAWSGLANIFSFYKNYFTQYSRQTIETVEISNEHQIAPGDFLQIYEQRTRYVTAFDAYHVNACGETNLVPGNYYLQWWGVAYHAYPINPYSRERMPRDAIGVAPMNNCPAELTPQFMQDNNDYIFARTN